MNIISTH